MSLSPVSALIGARLLAYDLHAVVVRRVVACGDHDAAVELLAERREVDELGAAHADVEHVDARVREALDQRRSERRARRADVAADSDPPRLHERRVGPADPVGEVLVEVLGDAAANVVGFEAVDLFRHGLRRVSSGQYPSPARGPRVTYMQGPEACPVSRPNDDFASLAALLPNAHRAAAARGGADRRSTLVPRGRARAHRRLASWWTACHGYNHPHIRAAVEEQLGVCRTSCSAGSCTRRRDVLRAGLRSSCRATSSTFSSPSRGRSPSKSR